MLTLKSLVPDVDVLLALAPEELAPILLKVVFKPGDLVDITYTEAVLAGVHSHNKEAR